MNDQQVGAAFRAVRTRRRMRQLDVATSARVSTATISRIERGHFDLLSLARLRRAAEVLDIKLETVARWRGGDLDRTVSARHAALHESIARVFSGLPGWVARPEVSFSIFGERGIVDALAWHAETRALLVIELKTEIVDINDLIGSVDRKRRLARVMARDLGWAPASVSAWVVVAQGRTTRRRIAEHRATLRSAFPADGKSMCGWLLAPGMPIAALSTWSIGRSRASLAPTKRVRMRERSAA